MSFNSSLNPNVVKTALDDVFYQNFQPEMAPGYANAETSAIFKQETADSSAVITETLMGTGLWGQKAEEADVQSSTPLVSDQKTTTMVTFADSVDIPKEFFDDNKHGTVDKMIKEFADMGRVTRDDTAFSLYRNAFTTTLTADGVALISDSHTNINGDTIDNKLTAALSESSLNDAIVALGEQKNQKGVVRGTLAKTLLVPLALYKTAIEITDSELRSGTANNDVNVYSSKYGIMVYTSERLGAAAGGSDTAWFLLGDNHSVTRYIREGVSTFLTDWKEQRNHNYIYTGRYRDAYAAIDYSGIIGSDGSA